MVDGDGRRKGRAPVGEAWLLEATVAKSTPVNLRYTYHSLSVSSVSDFRIKWTAQTYLPFQTAGIE